MKNICKECKEKEARLNRMGYSTSTHISLVSSFKDVKLCDICGKERNGIFYFHS